MTDDDVVVSTSIVQVEEEKYSTPTTENISNSSLLNSKYNHPSISGSKHGSMQTLLAKDTVSNHATLVALTKNTPATSTKDDKKVELNFSALRQELKLRILQNKAMTANFDMQQEKTKEKKKYNDYHSHSSSKAKFCDNGKISPKAKFCDNGKISRCFGRMVKNNYIRNVQRLSSVLHSEEINKRLHGKLLELLNSFKIAWNTIKMAEKIQPIQNGTDSKKMQLKESKTDSKAERSILCHSESSLVRACTKTKIKNKRGINKDNFIPCYSFDEEAIALGKILGIKRREAITELLLARKSQSAKQFVKYAKDLEQKKLRVWLWLCRNRFTDDENQTHQNVGVIQESSNNQKHTNSLKRSPEPELHQQYSIYNTDTDNWFQGPFYSGPHWQAAEFFSVFTEVNSMVEPCTYKDNKAVRCITWKGLGRYDNCNWPVVRSSLAKTASPIDLLIHSEKFHRVNNVNVPWR